MANKRDQQEPAIPFIGEINAVCPMMGLVQASMTLNALNTLNAMMPDGPSVTPKALETGIATPVMSAMKNNIGGIGLPSPLAGGPKRV